MSTRFTVKWRTTTARRRRAGGRIIVSPCAARHFGLAVLHDSSCRASATDWTHARLRTRQTMPVWGRWRHLGSWETEHQPRRAVARGGAWLSACRCSAAPRDSLCDAHAATPRPRADHRRPPGAGPRGHRARRCTSFFGSSLVPRALQSRAGSSAAATILRMMSLYEVESRRPYVLRRGRPPPGPCLPRVSACGIGPIDSTRRRAMVLRIRGGVRARAAPALRRRYCRCLRGRGRSPQARGRRGGRLASSRDVLHGRRLCGRCGAWPSPMQAREIRP